MNNDQLQLVTLGQAEGLKEIGFDLKTNSYYVYENQDTAKVYSNWNELQNWNDTKKHDAYSAPKVPLALKWARDVKGIRLGVQFRYTGYYGHFNETDDRANIIVLNGCDTYEQAESALLDAVIEELKKARKE